MINVCPNFFLALSVQMAAKCFSCIVCLTAHSKVRGLFFAYLFLIFLYRLFFRDVFCDGWRKNQSLLKANFFSRKNHCLFSQNRIQSQICLILKFSNREDIFLSNYLLKLREQDITQKSNI